MAGNDCGSAAKQAKVTSLRDAVEVGDVDAVKACLRDERCDVNVQTSDGQTALMVAVAQSKHNYKQINIVKLLLSRKDCSLDLQGILGSTALHFSMGSGTVTQH